MTLSELAELIAALDAEATPGPWKAQTGVFENLDPDVYDDHYGHGYARGPLVKWQDHGGSMANNPAKPDARIVATLRNHAAVLAEALRLCDLAEYIIDEDYKAADSRVSAEFKTRYRALCEEVSRE